MTVAAERAILSACLYDPNAVRFALEHVTGDDFYDMRLGQVFNLVVALVGAGTPVDGVTIFSEVGRRRAKDRGLWPSDADLGELITGSAVPALVGQYASEVREESVRRQAEVALTRGQQALASGAEPGPVIAQTVTELNGVHGSHRGGLQAKPLAEVLAGSDEYDWVIPGLLERTDRLIVTGSEGSGKTTWLRQIGILAAAGIHPTTFDRVDPVTVVVVDAENSERQWRRQARPLALRARHEGSADPTENLHLACTPRLDITKDRHLGAVHKLLDEFDPGILVIGPLYKLVPRAITNDDDAAPLITALDSLRDRGVCLVMEAHAGHAQTKGGDRDLRPRGSSALMGWPEFGFGLMLDRDQRQLAHLVRWRGDRDDNRSWPEQMERGGRWMWTPRPTWTPHNAVGAA